MGGSTVMVEDMKSYLESLRAVQGTGLRVIYPGHGSIIRDPDRVVGEYLIHRLEREAQILAAVRAGAGTVGEVVEAVYTDVDRALHAPAAVSVDAHLRKLTVEGVVTYHGGGWSGPVEALP
jgi:glyoxylase-like metal-dependent hydrolase (beta-lactamase superfamily II)